MDIIFFNSREGYIRKIMPVGQKVFLSGKVGYYKNKYQIVNPEYISPKNIEQNNINRSKYFLTEGLSQKKYNDLIYQVLNYLPDFEEWIDKKIIKDLNFDSWANTIRKLHNPNLSEIDKKNCLRRIAFDEIITNFIVLSKNRMTIKKIKKEKKIFSSKLFNIISKNFKFELTKDQIKVIKDINNNLCSSSKMFRILHGDVGSGKTIVAFLTSSNVIESGYQVAMMAPTDILAQQHYNQAKSLFKNTNVDIEYISGKTALKEKQKILEKIKNGKNNLIIGTHALFQKKIEFSKLGYVIIDEQHKFGVNQRMKLSKKGGSNCDTLVMSATPIPRTLVLSIYGDMDVSKIEQKPNYRKKIITYSKSEKKIIEIINFAKKEIKKKNQVFWVCPLINESSVLKYSSVNQRYKELKKIFNNKIEFIHGEMKKIDKDNILKRFLKKEIDVLLSTTVIEVGIDFPDANLIVIENSDKFGLAQLHQLRGRVGRGEKQGVCILMYKESLTKNAVKRIKILKENENGFLIAEEDLKLRGFGDLIGFKQSGEKYFKIADPLLDKELFEIGKNYVQNIEKFNLGFEKYDFIMKLFDKAEIISDFN